MPSGRRMETFISGGLVVLEKHRSGSCATVSFVSVGFKYVFVLQIARVNLQYIYTLHHGGKNVCLDVSS